MSAARAERYNQFQLKGQRAFSNGFNFLITYVYTRERSQINNFNDLTYYTNTFQWQDSNQPRHRMNIAGTYEVPIGKGRNSSLRLRRPWMRWSAVGRSRPCSNSLRVISRSSET